MDALEFKNLLIEKRACEDARLWAEGKDLKTVWETCERADWLLWLCGKMADQPNWPTRKEVVMAACDCAETALKFVKTGEDRPRNCIEVVRAWGRGEATIEKVREARRDAYAAAADATDATDAADAAAAAYAATDAADARSKALKEMADIVRSTIKLPIVEGR
jgi:hypothetical protein